MKDWSRELLATSFGFKYQLAQEFISPPKQVCIISWIMRCGIELMSLMDFMFEEYFLLFCMWNAFPVKQCSIEETLTNIKKNIVTFKMLIFFMQVHAFAFP